MKVIYILDVFPKISETFILNEILEMQKKCITAEVFVFHKLNEDRLHSGVSNIKKITYYSKHKVFKELSAHLYLFLTRPINYLKTLVFSLNRKNQCVRLFLGKVSFMILIVEAKPDHIHAHFGYRASNMAMLIHLLYGIPFTFTTHRYDIFDFPPRNYKIKSKLAKKHITISEYNKRFIVDKFNVAESNISVIHCGVDFQREFPTRCIGDKKTILCVARLEKLKGIDILIKACNELNKRHVDFECLIVGEGREREYLERLINQYALVNQIKLLGHKTQDEIFKLLAKACVTVLSSRSEGIPVALMEAMAMRVPVIGPNIYGVHELIDDRINGFLVEPENITELTEKMDILLKDLELRRRLSEKGYEKVRAEFNLKVETDKLLKIWTH